MEQRLQRLHEERRALCDALCALTGGAPAPAAGGAAARAATPPSGGAPAGAGPGGGGVQQQQDAWQQWQRRQYQQREAHHAQHQEQQQHQQQQQQQQRPGYQQQQQQQEQQQGPEQPTTLPPPLGFESFLAQSEIADGLMANTDAMGSTIRLHTCLGFGVLTDAQRARLWAWCFPLPVGGVCLERARAGRLKVEKHRQAAARQGGARRASWGRWRIRAPGAEHGKPLGGGAFKP
jgi:hypothetical protein